MNIENIISTQEGNSHMYEMDNLMCSTKKGVKSKAAKDELRRSHSVKQMIASYREQKLTIQEALCNIDRKASNKIVFEEDSSTTDKLEPNVNTEEVPVKKPIFQDDESDEENFYFDSKSYFDHENGQKLFELQSKFKSDKRFQLDQRFLPDDEHSDVTNVDKEYSIAEEKKNEINILEQVLGTKLTKSKKQNLEPKCLHKKMLRYDPSQTDHVQYQIPTPSKTSGEKIKHANQHTEEESPQPHVSKDVYYQVQNNLKSTLQSQQKFSLLEQFGRGECKESCPDFEGSEYNEEIVKNKNKFDLHSNPFRYDSSDDESDNLQRNAIVKECNNVQEFDNQNNFKFHPEPFFFKDDDFRYQDGSDFINRLASEKNAAFMDQRRSLKHIIKAKVRNNIRKDNPFKKKLGGHRKKKHLRITKALKR